MLQSNSSQCFTPFPLCTFQHKQNEHNRSNKAFSNDRYKSLCAVTAVLDLLIHLFGAKNHIYMGHIVGGVEPFSLSNRTKVTVALQRFWSTATKFLWADFWMHDASVPVWKLSIFVKSLIAWCTWSTIIIGISYRFFCLSWTADGGNGDPTSESKQ